MTRGTAERHTAIIEGEEALVGDGNAIGKDLPDHRTGMVWCDHGWCYTTFRERGDVMDKITRVGVDLATNVMQVHAVDGAERVVVRKAIARQRFVSWFANLEPCLVAMEACGAAHYWARKLRALGHDVRLIPPQFVAPYRKGGAHVKNDALDAEATCEAASRPHMRSVPVKSPAQQSVLVLHRMRTGFVEERTALVNRLRGLLAEFGVFLPQGIRQLRNHFLDRVEDGDNELSGAARQALMRGWAPMAGAR